MEADSCTGASELRRLMPKPFESPGIMPFGLDEPHDDVPTTQEPPDEAVEQLAEDRRRDYLICGSILPRQEP